MNASPRVLIVEDDEDIRMALRDLLSYYGYHAETACDGTEALALLQQQQFDILVSDYRMPHMDGVALLENCRTYWPPMPFILASGDSEWEAVSRMASTAYACLQKPFNLKQLFYLVRDAVERPAGHLVMTRTV